MVRCGQAPLSMFRWNGKLPMDLPQIECGVGKSSDQCQRTDTKSAWSAEIHF